MILDAIARRQSDRLYQPTPVPRPLLEECLEAARLAPSACNSQPWHFVVVDDPLLRTKLAEKIFSGPYAMNAFAKEAPVLVVIVSEKAAFLARIGGVFRGTPYYLIDIGIAIEHFILQAAAQGLGTCWIGWFDERKAREVLGIPKGKKIDAVVAVGYTSQAPREKKRKAREEIASFNGYVTKDPK